MAKITITIDNETRDIQSIKGKLTGSIKALKALGFKETNDEGEDLVHVKTFKPSTPCKLIVVVLMFIRSNVNNYKIVKI